MRNHRRLSMIILMLTFAPTTQGETLYIKASAARLRSSPSLSVDETIVGRVAQNRAVQVLERKTIPGKGSWLRVKSGGKTGWINAKITSKAKVNASPASVPRPSAPKAVAHASPPPAKKEVAKAKPTPTPPARPADVAAPIKAPEAAKPAEVTKVEPAKPAEVAKPAQTPKPAEVAQPKPLESQSDTRGWQTPPKPSGPVAIEPKKDASKEHKLKPNVPVVDKIADGPEKCITELRDGNKEQEAILGPLKAGRLHKSPTGATYSLNDHGRIVFTVHSLQKSVLKALVKGTGYSEDVVADAIKNGVVQFNGTVCRKGDLTTVKLEGTEVTAGRSGYLALTPARGGGFRASGQIADAKIDETFSAAGASN